VGRNEVKKAGMYMSSSLREGDWGSAGGSCARRRETACSTLPDRALCTKTGMLAVGLVVVWHCRFEILHLSHGVSPLHCSKR
jgi:hypothetical protein